VTLWTTLRRKAPLDWILEADCLCYRYSTGSSQRCIPTTTTLTTPKPALTASRDGS